MGHAVRHERWSESLPDWTARWRLRNRSVWSRQYFDSCCGVIPAIASWTLAAPLRFISTQSNVLVFILDHLLRRMNAQARVALQGIYCIIQRHFPVMNDVFEIPAYD